MKVFLTGASSGLGEALARHYAGAGATLGLIARRADRLQALRSSLSVPCETYEGDVRDLAAAPPGVERWDQAEGREARWIGNSGLAVWVIPANEERLIARDTLHCILSGQTFRSQM